MTEKICKEENILHAPYQFSISRTGSIIHSAEGKKVCRINAIDLHFHAEMIRRIAACLNACQDIPVEALENNVVKKMTKLSGAIEAQYRSDECKYTNECMEEAQGLVQEIRIAWHDDKCPECGKEGIEVDENEESPFSCPECGHKWN